MDQTLVDLLHQSNIISRPLGVNFRLKAAGKANLRLYFLVTVLWADLIYTVLLGLIPTEYEELILPLGDFAFNLVDKNRHYMTGAILAIRTGSTVMVAVFWQDTGNWLREASLIFEQLKSKEICVRLNKLRKTCQLVAVLCGTFLAVLTIAAHIMSTIIYHTRNSKYFLLPTHLYIFYYAVIYTFLNCQFMTELYFLSKICMEVFREINTGYGYELSIHKKYDQFDVFYDRFCKGCLFTTHMLSYGKKIYITYSICNMTIVVLVLYSAMYANSVTFQQTIYISYLGLNLFLINFLSHIIGMVDVFGKSLSDKIYEEFIILHRINRYMRQFYWPMLRYFQAVWGASLSMEIMGSPINSATSVMIMTVLLTVFAFMVGNFHIG